MVVVFKAYSTGAWTFSLLKYSKYFTKIYGSSIYSTYYSVTAIAADATVNKIEMIKTHIFEGF